MTRARSAACEVRVGTCGFCLTQREYYRRFAVIELQQTFYHPPLLATAERWRREAPEGFEFTLKAFQAITHPPASPTWRRSRLPEAERALAGGFRATRVVRGAWRTTLALARGLEARFVVFQCPASFAPTERSLADLRRFFGWAERGGLRFGFEPRGTAWEDALVRELCRELDLVHVVDPFEREPVHGVPRYFRLHGGPGYRHRYGAAELRWLLGRCTARPTYCLFNNLAMRDDARRFGRMVG
jgi:uncharacterized protein YecE (DUF72 family)